MCWLFQRHEIVGLYRNINNDVWPLRFVLQSSGLLGHIRNHFIWTALSFPNPSKVLQWIYISDSNPHEQHIPGGGQGLYDPTHFLCYPLLGNQGFCVFLRPLFRRALRKGPQINSEKLSKRGALTIHSHCSIFRGLLVYYQTLVHERNKPIMRFDSVLGFPKGTQMERSLFSDILCQGEKEANVPSTHSVFRRWTSLFLKGQQPADKHKAPLPAVLLPPSPGPRALLQQRCPFCKGEGGGNWLFQMLMAQGFALSLFSPLLHSHPREQKHSLQGNCQIFVLQSVHPEHREGCLSGSSKTTC